MKALTVAPYAIWCQNVFLLFYDIFPPQKKCKDFLIWYLLGHQINGRSLEIRHCVAPHISHALVKTPLSLKLIFLFLYSPSYYDDTCELWWLKFQAMLSRRPIWQKKIKFLNKFLSLLPRCFSSLYGATLV